MNGKFEEKLAQLAFGDVSPEEAARIEAQVGKDPAAERALAEFREMRDGLRGLAEVPEHQLSNERLRDAILARGLQPEPVKESSAGFGAGWIWMPVAALALGFGLVMLRPHSATKSPELVLNESRSLPSPSFDLSIPDRSTPTTPSALGTFAKNGAAPKSAKPKATLVADRTPAEGHRPRRQRRHDPRFTPDVTPIEVGKWKPVATVVASNDNHSAAKSPTNSASPKDALVADSTPIVLIDSNPDAATGAPTATEVGTASNVLIGG